MTNPLDEGHIKYDVQHSVATITFFHPAHNSLPSRLLGELASMIDKAGNDENAKVIVLKSEGDRTFCAGASFDELLSINDRTTGLKFFSGFANVINACRKCSKIIIGRVQGKAVGGGVGLASAVDYCLATKYSAIKLSELAVGIGPFVVGPAVKRKIGLSAFSQLAIDATSWQNAYWAKDKGLFTNVFDSTKEMDEAIELLCEKLVRSNPQAMSELKNVFWEDCADWDNLLIERAKISGELVLSPFAKTAINKIKS